MSLIREDTFVGLPVVTRLGQKLGRVHHLVLDVDSLALNWLEVKPTGRIGGLWHKDLIIRREIIVCVSSKAVVVEDTVLTSSESSVAAKQSTEPPPLPVPAEG